MQTQFQPTTSTFISRNEKKNRRHLPRAAGEASIALIVFCYKTKKTEKSLERKPFFFYCYC